MHCSICELEANSFPGTFLVQGIGRPMSKEKRFPTSERARWVRIDDKIYERWIICPFCIKKHRTLKDPFLSRDGNE